MNSLTDLRRTLDQHAEDVADPAAVARTSAVHHRIAGVRRRRRVVGSGAVSLALLAGVAAVVLPRVTTDALPAAPSVLGVTAPTTQQALGFTYRTDGHGASFDRSGSVDVPKSDEPQLYSWTTTRPTRVTVTLPDREIWDSELGDFRDYVVIPAGESGHLTVSVAHGRVGVASYDLTDAIPVDAVSKNGITFRRSVDETPLLGAAVSDRGQTETTTSFVVPRGDVALASVCSGLPRGDAIHVSFDGATHTIGSSAQCDASRFFDAGAGPESAFRPLAKPGTTVRVRMWVTAGLRKSQVLPAGSVPDLRMGVGVYGPLEYQPIGGNRVQRYLEQGGHTWSFQSGVSGTTDTSGRRLTMSAARGDRVAQVAFDTKGFTRVEFRAGTTRDGGSVSGGQGAVGGFMAPAGSDVHVHLVRGTGAFGLALYQRTD